jgi:hypothetical protein
LSRKTYGFIAGLIAAGVSAWWWRNRIATALSPYEAERGTVIFDNTPQASSPDGNI